MSEFIESLPLRPINVLASGTGVVLGLVFHYGFFNRGEWHVYAPELFISHTILFATLSAGSVWYHGSDTGDLLTTALLASVAYFLTLMASILIYRVFFHQLTKMGFKGPLYMRTSKLWHVWNCRTSLNHLFLNDLNKQYGDFVRTGIYSNHRHALPSSY